MDELEQGKKTEVAAKGKYLRPNECRSLMRKTLAREFQEIVDGFVAAAKKGSCPHVKLATELLKPIRTGPSRKKGSATLYWEMLEREAQEKEKLKREEAALTSGTSF